MDCVINVTNCQRCGGEHQGLVARKYSEPVGLNRATHWTACPERRGEPFLVDWHYVTMFRSAQGAPGVQA